MAVRRLLRRIWLASLAWSVILFTLIMFWPISVRVTSLRSVDPASVSPQLRLAFQAEGGMVTQSVRLLQRQAKDRGLARLFRDLVLSLRVAAFTSTDQQATFLASTWRYLPGVYDLATVTKRCFATSPGLLGLAEAAELVVRARAPVRYSDETNGERLREQRDRLLQELADEGFVSQVRVDEEFAKQLGRCS